VSYACPADDQREDHGLWTLRLHAQKKAKWLGLLTRWEYIHFDRRLCNERQEEPSHDRAGFPPAK
jgi:hypothetical protein